MKILDVACRRWRANFHTHTTESDGSKTPQEAMALYRGMGYDILALTDHRVVTRPEHVPEGLLLIPGIEMDFFHQGQVVHLLGLGMDASIEEKYRLCKTPRQAIAAVRRLGGRTILAHPAWSLNTPAYMASLKGLWGAEIWNSVSTLPLNAIRADSSSLLDVTAAGGAVMNLFANDDTHAYESELGGGWNMIQAEELSLPAVLKAVDQGRFYATQGPEIHDLILEGRRLTITCSPASAIIFYSNQAWVSGRSHLGEGLTRAEYDITPRDTFIRVQVMDARGRSAWTSPVEIRKG